MKFIPKAVSTVVGRGLLKTEKNSPQLLLVTGLVGMGATVVLACKATLELDSVLQRHEDKLDQIALAQQNVNMPEYTDASARKDRITLTTQTTVALCKLYGPAIITGAVSYAAIIGSHRILSKRNVALAAAYGAMEKAYGEYRQRVRDKYGEEAERDIFHDSQICEIEDPETGKKTKQKRSTGPLSPYARLFHEQNPNWCETPAYNYTFLRLQQNWANQRLQSHGHLFLNEVYDALGIPRSPEGQVVGWVKGNGDDFVDFGCFNQDREGEMFDFMVGREKEIWLDFNVDGTVYDKI